jgi:hypothetical protein
MSLEAGNRRKSPVTLAVTAGYFFSLKKIMREIQRTVRVSTDQKLHILRYFRKVFGSGPSFHCGSVSAFPVIKKTMSKRQNFDNKPKIDLKC